MNKWHRSLLILLMLIYPPSIFAAQAIPANNTKCVQIYYDYRSTNSDAEYYNARSSAIILQNLISHFPNIQQYVIPIDLYQKGQLNRCDASFYLGTIYANSVPNQFLQDFVKTKKNVTWIGYHMNQFAKEDIKKLWSATFNGDAVPDWKVKDSKGRPNVYLYYEYKNQVFERLSIYANAGPDKFQAYYNNVFDLALMELLNPADESNVISWAKSTLGDKKTPYILKSGNRWYITGDPFSYVVEGDRYFIVADILFDILNESPEDNGKKYALIRYEDVSPNQTITKMKTLSDMFVRLKTPFTIALFPVYADPLHVYKSQDYIELRNKPDFISALNYARDHGATFIMHGVTHQYDHIRDPFSGVSAEDYEFWNMPANSPIAEDSVNFVVNRLTAGIKMIRDAGFQISAWMTPHYYGSILDDVLFGQLFTWNITRGSYVPTTVCNQKPLPQSLTLNMGALTPETNQTRLDYFKTLTVEPYQSPRMLQLLPYPIFGDYYDRHVIPEDLGNIQPFLNQMVAGIRTVDDILKDAKRYSVLRDVWASFFIHDLMLNLTNNKGVANFPGDTSELERLIKTIQSYGYEFVDLKTWTQSHLNITRPAVIETYPPKYAPQCGKTTNSPQKISSRVKM